jgi:hypothetical protein
MFFFEKELRRLARHGPSAMVWGIKSFFAAFFEKKEVLTFLP